MSPADQRVVSLGTLCLTATLLQSMGLKRESYPFDWVFSTPEMISHCLDDDFATLLEKSHYVPGRQGERQYCHHTFYNGLPKLEFAIFKHHDPSTEEGYDYLVRCVARFRVALATTGSLFVLLRQGGLDDVAQFETVASAMRRREPSVTMRYLSFYQNPDQPGLVDTVAADGNCALVSVSTRTLLRDGIEFVDPADDELMRRLIRTVAAETVAQPAPLDER